MKKTLAIVLWAFFLLHFLLLFTYVMPSALFPKKLVYYSSFYANPLFHQQWELFAPEPPMVEKQIVYRFRTRHSSEWTAWIDPAYVWNKKHHQYRLTHHTPLFHINERVAFYLMRQVEQMEARALNEYEKKKYLASGYAYKAGIHYVKKHAEELLGNSEVSSIQLRLVLRSIQSPHQKHREGRVEPPVVYDFPTFYVGGTAAP